MKQPLMKHPLRIVLLGVLGVSSISAFGQGTCSAPWNSFPFLYGTINITGSGTFTESGTTETTNQSISIGTKAFSGTGQCLWSGGATSAGAKTNAVVTINDSQQTPGCLYTWTASGAGQGSNPEIEFGPTAGVYAVGATGIVNGTSDLCGTSTNGALTWGPFDIIPYIPNNIPIPSAPLLTGSADIQAPSAFNPTANWHWVWSLSPFPDDNCDPCKKKLANQSGSVIASRDQSLEEDVPITGTPFILHYESERQAGRAGADVIAIMDAQNLGGWTLDVHHALEQQLLSFCFGGCVAYAVIPKALYLGDGGVRSDMEVQAPVVFNGKYYLTSEDGDEVYEFDGSSARHLRTLAPMTGVVIYSFGYDASGQLTSITDAAGNMTSIQRDASEHPTMIVAPFGQITTLAVDANGYLSKITGPLGHSTVLSNGSLGLLNNLTDPKGKIYTFTYDTYGRLTKHSDPAGGSIALARTNITNGFKVAETTAMSVKSSFQATLTNSSTSATQSYINTWPSGLQATETDTESGGQLTENVHLPDGTAEAATEGPDPRWGIQAPVETSSSLTLGTLTMNTTETRTASLGTAGNPFSLTTQTDTEAINGREYTSAFTASTLTYLDTTPAGRKTTTILDTLERPASFQVGTLSANQFGYDSHGRLATSTQGTRVTTYAYDTNGFLSSVTDPLGLVTSFTSDAEGKMLTEKLADGRVISFTYDADGNLASVKPPGKTAHKFAYDAVNDPSSYTPPVVTGTGATTYAYNKDQNPTLLTRPDGRTVSFAYDSAGRLISTVTPTETINYAYNGATGNLSSAAIPTGESIAYGYNGPLPTSSTWTGTVAGGVSRTFNNNFWVASEAVTGGTTVNFTYDTDGLVTQAGSLIVKQNSNGLISGTTLGNVTDTRTYNSFGELTGYTASYGATPLYSATYTRDKNGRATAKTETIGGTTTTYAYTYDHAGRLTAVKQNGVLASTYTYDTNSNRLTATTPSGAAAGTYDAQDRMLTYGSAAFTYTGNGELASRAAGAQTTSYLYDTLGNLTSVALPSATNLTYLVDPENRRVAKQVNGTQQIGFLYDDDVIVAQLNGNNQAVSQFVYGTASFTPDYMIHSGANYRIISDQVGSPRLVVNATTGAIAEQIGYDEFGNVKVDSDAGFQPFGFGGGLRDPDTGFVRFGARDYDPSTGRWTAKDPVLFDGEDTNLYGYVLNDPVNFGDNDGTTIFRLTEKDFRRSIKKKEKLPDKKPCKCKRMDPKVSRFLQIAKTYVPGQQPYVSQPPSSLELQVTRFLRAAADQAAQRQAALQRQVGQLEKAEREYEKSLRKKKKRCK